MLNRSLFKRIFFLSIVSALFLLAPLSLSAEQLLHRTVRVGFFPFDGYHMKNDDGSRTGYGYDYIQRMNMYEGWNLKYIGFEENKSWSDMLAMLADGEIDLLTSATKTPEREKLFDFSTKPIGTSSTILMIRAGNTRYEPDSPESWSGMSVGMIEGNSRNGSFADYARSHHFSYRPVYYNSESELTEKLASGAIDAVVTSNLRHVKNEWLLAYFDSKPFYAIVKKGNKDLLREVNDAIDQISSVSPELPYSLYRKYYSPDNGGSIAFTKGERDYIESCRKNGTTFTAVIDFTRPPYSYIENGKQKGILTDICREIFARTGLSISFTDISDRTKFVGAKDVKNNDICCDLCSHYAHAEEKGFILTDPYCSGSLAILLNKHHKGPVNKVALVANSIIAEYIKDSLESSVDVMSYDTIGDCVRAVKEGEVDEAYLFTRTAQEAIFHDQTNQLTCVTLSKSSIEFAIGVNKNQSHFLASIIDKAVLSLNPNDISALSAPYEINEDKPLTLIGLCYDKPLYFVCIVGVIFLIATLIVTTIFFRKKQQAEKVAGDAKTAFISRISHDIRTPIGAISNMTWFAFQDIDDRKKLIDDLVKIKTSNTFLLSLINDVLDISKIDSGKIELHPEPYPFTEYCENIKNMFEPLCKEKGLKFIITPPAACGTIVADKIRINQILFNIMSNAIKFTPSGGSVTYTSCSHDLPDGKIKYEYTVEDTGIGMSSEFQKKLFEPFTQEYTNPLRPKAESGTGLGLSIVKKMIDLMGGTIAVKSEVGKGTQVRVSMILPRAPSTITSHLETKLAPASNDARQPLSGKILLAEDNEINTEIAVRILDDFGLNVTCAANGEQAVSAFEKSAPGEFALILMDLQMPVMNGYEAAKKIRSSNRSDSSAIPIFALTADAFAEAAEKCKKVGMNGQIVKPIEPGRLYEVIKANMKHAESL